MKDPIGIPITHGDYIAFPVHVGRVALMRYGKVVGFGTSEREERANKDTVKAQAAYREFEGEEFGSLDRCYSVDPTRCVRLSHVPDALKEVIP